LVAGAGSGAGFSSSIKLLQSSIEDGHPVKKHLRACAITTTRSDP
jgi:hypothetical protein